MTKTAIHQLKGLVEEKLFGDDGCWNLAKRQKEIKIESLPRGLAIKKLKVAEDSSKIKSNRDNQTYEFRVDG